MKTTHLLAVHLFAAGLAGALAAPSHAADAVTFGTNWLAQPEHGGYYQAVADGTYERYGLEVTIRQGGPRVPNRTLLVAGQIEFYMGGPNTAINAVGEGVPMLTLAAIFQKDPQVLLSHPDAGFMTFEDLADASRYIISTDGYITFFQWMQSRWPQFIDEKYEPYNFSPAPFLADPRSIQQGYLTSEPRSIERAAGWSPDVWLLADHGFSPYSTTIAVMRPWYEENQDIAKRFVEASIIGWYNYLYGDNAAANDLIKRDNPDMTDDQIAYGVAKLKEYGIVISGDAETGGIGCMTDARWREFYEQMVSIGVFEPGIDVTKAYTTELVCQGLGVELAR